MTAEEFRRIALGLPEAEERSHMKHPDFRVRGKIFATMGYPDADCGMVKLTPEQQRFYVAAHPAMFVPVKGAWGLKGCTQVRLPAAEVPPVAEAIAEAWRIAGASAPARAARKKSAR